MAAKSVMQRLVYQGSSPHKDIFAHITIHQRKTGQYKPATSNCHPRLPHQQTAGQLHACPNHNPPCHTAGVTHPHAQISCRLQAPRCKHNALSRSWQMSVLTVSMALLASIGMLVPQPELAQALTIASLAREFAYTDKDGDGEVSASEVQYALKKRYSVDVPVEAVASEFLPAVDLNGDGRVPTEEFLRALALMDEPGLEMWEIMDRNRDGVVELTELKRALGDVGEGSLLVDWQFGRADRYRDGRLTVPEWIEVMGRLRDGLLGFGGQSMGLAGVNALESQGVVNEGEMEEGDDFDDLDSEDEVSRLSSLLPF